MNARLRPWVVGACRLAVALVFAAAALPKIADPAGFASQIHYYRLVPLGLENLIAITLPWVELMVALALVAGVHARSGAILAAGLLGIFTLAVITAVARGLDIGCGCFGTADATRVGSAKLLENAGLLAVACIASLEARRSPE